MIERGPLIAIEHSGLSLTGQKLRVCYWSPDYVIPPCVRAEPLGDLFLFPVDYAALENDVLSRPNYVQDPQERSKQTEKHARDAHSAARAGVSVDFQAQKIIDKTICSVCNTANSGGLPPKTTNKNRINRSDFLTR